MFYDTLETEKDKISKEVVKQQLETNPQLEKKYTQEDINKCISDTRYTLTYLIEALRIKSPSIFINYVLWLQELLESYGINKGEIINNLKLIYSILEKEYQSEKLTTIENYINLAVKRLKKSSTSERSYIKNNNPLSKLAHNYLEYLMSFKREKAVNLIMKAAEKEKIADIYLHVLQPVQQEIGRLWQKNEVTVAHEHYCSSITQLIMSRLYPSILGQKSNGLTAITTCVGSELHEIGIRMVADLLELEGWDTIHLGANVPVSSVLDSVEVHRADLVGISATTPLHLQKVKKLISGLKNKDVKIMVGGYLFNNNPDLWKKFYADGYAADGFEATGLASRLVKGGTND